MKNQRSIAGLGSRLLLLDGAMGTTLQRQGLAPGMLPEVWNLDRSQQVVAVHQEYLEAGAQIIETNTFGANRLKLGQFGLAQQVNQINAQGVRLARTAISQAGRSGTAWVAGVIGPLGELLEPFGPLTLAEARACFQEQAQALVAAGADLLLIQTMSDLAEARQGVLAARDLGVPVFCSLTFEASGRTLTGVEPEAAVIALAAAGAAVVGINCSLGPQEMAPLVARMVQLGLIPVLAEPNAGLPSLQNGQTIFPQGPAEFAAGIQGLIKAGAAVVGGCCGTTAEHIALLAQFAGQEVPRQQRSQGRLYLASRTGYTVIGAGEPIRLIGERLNPTGRKNLAAAIVSGDFREVAAEARKQVEVGAELLDVNVGVPGVDEVAALSKAVTVVSEVSGVPLVLDSTNPQALEAGAQAYQGKALLNSVSAQRASLEAILPVAKAYGAAVLGLTLTEKGIPERAEDRLAAAQVILETALEYGLDPNDIIIDCLTLTVGAQPEAARQTLKAMDLVKKELGLATVLGVSNISHGLPNRRTLNNVFLAMAAAHGLDAAILNPFALETKETLTCANLLTGRDGGAQQYLLTFGSVSPKTTIVPGSPGVQSDKAQQLRQIIITGAREECVPVLQELLSAGWSPLTVIDQILTPALEEVGRKYEEKVYFLPNLLLAAEAAQKAFTFLRSHMPSIQETFIGKALLATVEGDIHDIGKNILRALLQNHGFETIDLGKDVPVEMVVKSAQEEQPDIVLLSALMTTTLPAMERTVVSLKKIQPRLPVMVGGAVVTRSYAEQIGATGYAKDAVGGVQLAKELVARSK